MRQSNDNEMLNAKDNLQSHGNNFLEQINRMLMIVA